MVRGTPRATRTDTIVPDTTLFRATGTNAYTHCSSPDASTGCNLPPAASPPARPTAPTPVPTAASTTTAPPSKPPSPASSANAAAIPSNSTSTAPKPACEPTARQSAEPSKPDLAPRPAPALVGAAPADVGRGYRSEEHKSELQSLMRNSYAVYCLKKKNHGT